MQTAYTESFKRAAAQLEERRVQLILDEFGLSSRQSSCFRALPQELMDQLCDEQYSLTGERRLSFAAFDRVFPGFPICLESQSLYRLGTHSACSQTAMFRNFPHYLPYRMFLKVQTTVETRAAGRPVGIIYPWPGIRHGLLLHNGEFPTAGFKQTFTDGAVHVTVERYQPFVRTLAASGITLEAIRTRTMTFAEDLPACKPRLEEMVWRGESVHEARMLAVLEQAMFHTPPDQSKRYVRRYGGERWMVVTQEQLAEQLGVSMRTVQRTIASLRKKKFIEVQRTEQGTSRMRLCPETLQ